MDNRNDENRVEQDVQETAQPEKKEAGAGTEKKAETLLNGKPLNGKKRGFNSAKWKRGGMATALTAVFIAIVVVINILVGLLTDRFPSLNMDLTAQKLNTLSDQAVKIAQGVEQETTIYLIGSEDNYRNDRIYSSYGLEYSQVANLAEKLREVNTKISVKFIDPDTNPTFISAYPDDALGTGKVLVETERRHKVLTVADLFTVTQNSTTYRTETYSKVDSALASALEVVNLDKVPVIAVITGHGELLGSNNMSNFLGLLEDQNYEVKEVDFLTEEIPENTQIVMLPTPTTDYTDEEIQKLRTYIDDTARPERCALLVTCHPSQGALPKLAAFLEEWGIRVEEGMVAETDASRVALGNASFVLVDHTEELLNDDDYSRLVSPLSRPITRLFEANGDVVQTESLWTTADTAYVATEDMVETDPADIPKSSQTVAAIAEKRPRVDGKSTARSVVVFGSSHVFLDQYMSAAFGDKTYIANVLSYCTDTDGSQVTVMTHQVQTNVLDVTASSGTINLLGLGVFAIGLPLLILVVGLVVFLKRRHL